MLDTDGYDAEDLDDFIVSEEEPHVEQQEEEEPLIDRIGNFTAQLRVNESYTSKVLRAHVSVLVSALGGPDHTSNLGLYKLGHDALACLKDLKRWLRSVDERNGTYDVALACAESGLVANDLTVILCQWDKPSESVKRTKTTDKIMLACLELLVLLTWPVDVNRNTLLKDYTARTSARRAQLAYKLHILAFKNGGTLKAVIRLGLGPLTMERDDREPRDINILRLILFFIRNVLYIEALPASKAPKAITNSSDLPNGMNPEDIGLNAVLPAFEKNKVLMFLLSIAHSVQSDFTDDSFGLLVVECLSLLTRGVKSEALLLPQRKRPVEIPGATTQVPTAASVVGMQLQDLLSEEDKRKRQQKNTVSTRHGRFGTLLSIQTPDNSSSYTVSGQEALASTHQTLDKLDRTKSWHKTSAFKYDSNAYVQKSPSYLSLASSLMLLNFVDLLLVSGSFNNLLRFVGHHLTNISNDGDLGGKGILDAVDEHELASYFLTISWFLRYKRERHLHFVENMKSPLLDEDGLDYGSVGSALSEVNFILLISYFRASFESKNFDSLHVAMICLREMLLISNTIFNKARTQEEIDLATEEDINEDRELAEGIIRKLFSQKQFLDVVVNIPKVASKHSPEYLSVVVAVVHIILKCFESLANEDVKLFIKSRRKMSKLNKQRGLNDDSAFWHLIDRGSDEEDEEDIRYITQERKLDYKNTEVKFFHTDTVSTHIAYLLRYEDLTHEEIKRGISFFHRLLVLRKDYVALYRLDFMNLIYRLRAFLPKSSSIRRHVEEFILYFMKKFKVALDRFPVAVELLFPRFEDLGSKGFLGTGDLEVAPTSNARERTSSAPGLPKASYFSDDSPQPRSATLLEFHEKDKSLDDKIGVLVYHLIRKKNALKFLKFLIGELLRLATLREQGITQPILRLNLSNRRLLINDSHLRLMVEILGFDLPFLQNDETILRETIAASELLEGKNLLEKWILLHEGNIGDIEPFLDQVRQQIFTREQLEFGVKSLADLKAGVPVVLTQAASLGLTPTDVHKVIGLAKRKEYDETVAAKYYADDDFISPAPGGSYSDHEFSDDEKSQTKKTRRRQRGNHEHMELEDDVRPSQSRKSRSRKDVPEFAVDSDDERRLTKSAEYVHDSDDESDDERVQDFFAKEEKLRQLLQETGGIFNKDQLHSFRESWLKIVSTNSESQVKDAVDKATSLFVEDLDDEVTQPTIFSQNDTPLTSGGEANQKRSLEGDAESSISRKRRVIVDDDDE